MDVVKKDIEGFLGRSDTCFKIPSFQRQYSWHEGTFADFLADFEEAVRNSKPHYLGSIFFQTLSLDESVIIDGQQRVTTILLMLTAICHLLQDNPDLSDDTDLIKRMKRRFLENDREHSREDNRIRLRSMTEDDEIFKRIYNRKTKEQDKASNLYKAYSYFLVHFTEQFAKGLKPADYIDGLKYLKIIAVELEKEDNPQKIFESINSTGVKLNEGDKIRNFALMLNDSDIHGRVLDDYWSIIEGELVDTQQGNNYIDDFFHNFLIAHLHQNVKEGEVYAKFKVFFRKKVENQDDARQIDDFYSIVTDDLARYLLLKFNKDDSGQYAAIRRQVFRINNLGIEVVYPFLMRVLGDYKAGRLSQTEVQEFLHITESYLIRRIIAGITSQGLNKLFYTLYRDIVSYSEEHEGAKHTEIYKYVLLDRQGVSRFPTSRYIEERFTNRRIGSKSCYFILSSWDDFKQPKESFLLQQIGSNASSYSIEHIMPQKLTPSWRRELGANHQEVHERYLHCLANLTLTGYNSEYSNKSFQEKLKHPNGYKQSPLLINDFIKKQTTWNEEVIKQRIDWWMETIEKMWPMIQTDFRPKRKGVKALTLADVPEDLYYSKPVSLTIQDAAAMRVNHWHELLDCFLDNVYDLDSDIITKLINDPKTTRWVSAHPEDFHASAEINDSGYFVSTKNDTFSKIEFIRDVARLAGIDQTDVTIEILFRDPNKKI